jgi:integrase
MAGERRIALVVEPSRRAGELPAWAAAWHEHGRPVKRRVGRAWLARAGSPEAKPDGKVYGRAGVWVARRGRPTAGALDEQAARVLAAQVAEQAIAERAAALEESQRGQRTFRVLARRWQAHMRRTGGHKPSTARDIASVLAEPATAYRRGTRLTVGRLMARLGDLDATAVGPADVERVLESYEQTGASPRTVNKAREVIRAMYAYGIDPDLGGWELTQNPAARTVKRRLNHAAAVRHFEIDQVEAIAGAAETGTWREPRPEDCERNETTLAEEAQENEQLADLIRIAAYTGLRQGELVALRWRDVNLTERVLTVERALSGTVELSPKSGLIRVVPLADQALKPLKRLNRRPNFTGPDDYVFAAVTGDRPDPSALRRRYNKARDTASAPPLPFHALRHTAGSLFVRKLDPVTVQAILGHQSIKTTERYMHPRRATELADHVTNALIPTSTNPDLDDDHDLLQSILNLPPTRRQALLNAVNPKPTTTRTSTPTRR